jgi:hypothetical protein
MDKQGSNELNQLLVGVLYTIFCSTLFSFFVLCVENIVYCEVNFVLGLIHRMVAGGGVDVSEVHALSFDPEDGSRIFL